ncbi:MAG TPA: response regulator transcription factor [Puia sp.]|jgi:DNA-binding NarL/FixJ family response regulator|nr:response regulator transcription factor [Puia sp.]
MPKISVVVIDDHALIRESWTQLLKMLQQFEVVGDSGDSEKALEIVRDTVPDIIFLDINIKPKDGFETIKEILQISPTSKVIALSMYTLPAYAKKMISLGAKAYVTKNSSVDEIMEAVTAVNNGEIYICREILNIATASPLEKEQRAPNLNLLSEREVKVLQYVKRGLSSREISSELKISYRTVEVHRHKILKKLNLKNTPSLINYLNFSNADI